MHTYTQASAALSAALIVIAATSGLATAQSDEGDSIIDEVFDDDDSESRLSALREAGSFGVGYAKGWASRITAGVTDLVGDEETWSVNATASTLRSDITTHAGDYESWLNNRTTADTSRDVLEVTVENETASETFYVAADVENGTYRNLTATGSTNRTVDETCTLSGRAAEEAPGELETFRSEYVTANESVPPGYLGRMAAEYSEGIDCTFDTSS